jgi:hypothetical protein
MTNLQGIEHGLIFMETSAKTAKNAEEVMTDACRM